MIVAYYDLAIVFRAIVCSSYYNLLLTEVITAILEHRDITTTQPDAERN